MSLLKKLGLGPKDAADAVIETAEGVADIVERWKPSEKAKHDMHSAEMEQRAKFTEQARAYDPRSEAQDKVSSWINVGVDALNRLIRPAVAILLVGATFGVWDLRVTTADPIVLGWTELVVGFYFGVRALTQDLPSMLKALKQLKDK